MSWYTGSISNAVGALIAVLDVELVKNSHWTIFDASAGANAKVYRCYDPDDGTDFFWLVDDNVSADYARTKLYETWDAGTHTGTGGLSTYASFRHKLGTYNISLDDTQVIYIDTDGAQAQAGFVGRVKVIDPTLPQVIVIMGDVGASNAWLALTGTDPAYTSRILLRGPTGVASQPFGYAGYYGADSRFSLDVNGHAWFTRDWIQVGYRLVGYIEGVIPMGSTATFGHGDIISIGGEDWVAVEGESNGRALVKK